MEESITVAVTPVKENINTQILAFRTINDLMKSVDMSSVDTVFGGDETIGFELWTPEIASYQLRHNEDNRNKQWKACKKYIDDMLEKKFGLSGDCIIIDNTGNLLNGQNRCEAIARSGKPQVVVVLRNVLPESRKWGDIGAKQSNQNRTQMFLKPLYKDFKDDMWGVACRILAYKLNCKQHELTNEIDIVVEFVRDNLELLKKINEHPTRGTNVRNNPLFKALEFLFMEEDEEKAETFAELVLNGGASVNTAPLALIKWNQELTEHTANHGEECAEIATIQAWDAFKKGIKLKKIKVYEDKKALNTETGECSKPVLKSEYRYENYCKTLGKTE